MQVAASAAPIVIEGPSDEILLKGFLNARSISLIVANGKMTALEVVEILLLDRDLDEMVGPLLVLVDRDSDVQPGRQGRLIRTVGRDLDAEVAAIPELMARVVRSVQYVSDEDELVTRINEINRVAHILRCIRECAEKCGVPVQVKRIKADLRRFSGDWDELLEELGVQQSDRAGLHQSLQEAHVREPSLPDCQGHDIHGAIALGASKTGRDQVQRFFLAAVRLDEFKNCPTGSLLEAWANEHHLAIWRVRPLAA